MAAKKPPRTPSFRHHKGSGQGFVEIDGHRYYLGKHELSETRQRYHRMIAEWLANARQLPVQPDEITVAGLIARFWMYAEGYYRKVDGSPTDELNNFRQALRPLASLYGSTKVREFSARRLKTVREQMIGIGWCRTNINKMVGRLKRLFRWGVENELVSPAVYQSITALSGLRWGRSEARESEPVKPVSDAIVEAAMKHMTPTVRTMVMLQRLTGMRPGEVVSMRGCDLDTSAAVWTYKPEHHKTQYRGRDRVAYLGPKAQSMITKFLRPNTQEYLFSPIQSERERREAMHAARETPLSCGNRPGSNLKRRPRKQASNRYNTKSYEHSITYACDRASPPPDGLSADSLKEWRRAHRWSPGQLRHNFATEVRRDYGLESAQVLLGHSKCDITQVYAERDQRRAVEVALKIG